MRVVDLFCGFGGASLGLHRAGFEHVECVDWTDEATATLGFAVGAGLFSRPHPAWGAGQRPIVRTMDVRQWQPVAADAWWASPPCQAFTRRACPTCRGAGSVPTRGIMVQCPTCRGNGLAPLPVRP